MPGSGAQAIDGNQAVGTASRHSSHHEGSIDVHSEINASTPRAMNGHSRHTHSGAGVDSARAPLRRRLLPRLGGRDIAIDLGTANTLVFVRGEGIVVSEPSVVAVDTSTGAVHAVGEDAQQMIGRTPATISAIRPLRHGVIADFDVTEQMLRHFIARVHRSRFAHPRVMMCAPFGITDVEQRALVEAGVAAGARSVHLIEEPLAAAIGAGLAIDEPRANVVVDVGGGTSEVAVLSLGGIVVSRSLRVGGYDLDEAVAVWLRQKHGLAIGETTSERVKLEVGAVAPDRTEASTDVRGRDPVSGLPRQVDVPSEEIRQALESRVAEIVTEVKSALEETPPELASDLPQRGILLAGGGALLRGFAERLEAECNVPVRLAEDPLTCVALGAGRALDEMEMLERSSSASAHRPIGLSGRSG
jgi:rod shape-determining protein MreB